ncbi:MAG: multiheme c-type cytochrome [Myxococcota bacterium]
MKLFALALAALAACSSPTPTPNGNPTPLAVDAAPAVTARPPARGEATLFLMADIRGILRPCGCTVDLQKGGFDRLIPFLGEQRKQYPAASLLHAGPLFYEGAEFDAKKKAQLERQAEVTADLVAQTHIDIAAATPADEVASGGKLMTLAERAKVQVTAANLTLPGKAIPPRVVKEIGGIRIGIFALAATDEAKELPPGVTVSDPEAAATETVAQLRKEADVIVLLSDLGLRETKRLVRKVEGIDFAVAGGMGEHPSVSEEAEAVGGTRVLQFHREGRFLGRLTVRLVGHDAPGGGRGQFVDASAVSDAELAALDERIRKLEDALKELAKTKPATDLAVRSADHHLASVKTERDRLAQRKVGVPVDQPSFSFTQTPLDWDLPQDPGIVGIMKAFDEELAKINIANAGTLPEAKPGQAVYVGTDACIECHEETKEFWKTTPHSSAWKTLVDAGKTFDVECVSCHVTGYGQAGGSLIGHTQGREDVQCEACHGPGSLHSKDGDKATIVRAPTEDTCTTCHNHHHSPKFAFATFREQLLVPGHGKPLH